MKLEFFQNNNFSMNIWNDNYTTIIFCLKGFNIDCCINHYKSILIAILLTIFQEYIPGRKGTLGH